MPFDGDPRRWAREPKPQYERWKEAKWVVLFFALFALMPVCLIAGKRGAFFIFLFLTWADGMWVLLLFARDYYGKKFGVG